jgi:hypothetical protein
MYISFIKFTSSYSAPLQPSTYSLARQTFYQYAYAAAKASNVATVLPWELVPWQLSANEGSGYDFDFSDPSSSVMANAAAHQEDLVGPPALFPNQATCR